jgi:hypothetical protein
VLAHKSELIDDNNCSLMLEATWGVGLGKQARSLREREQKAEYDLPFRDKKETPAAPPAKKSKG